MAESKVTLRMESQEYEQKLKRATNKLLEMEAACKKVGGTMAIAEQKDIEFARSLGSMETKAKDAKGRINELTKAFTETSLAYKRLTDEEKQSPYGQALAKSATELKGRLNEAKTELASVTGESTKQTSAVGELISKYGGFATALAAGSAALKVAKDAFMSTEQGVDDFGRTLEAATSSYNTFCQSLATGNFDTLLTNLGNIIQRAKDTYDALDNLKTVGGIISNQEAMLNAKRAQYQKIIKDPNATEAQKSAARAGLAGVQQQKAAAIDETKALNNDYIKKALRNQAGVLTDDEYNRYYPLIVKSLYSSAAKDVLDQTTVTRQGVQAISNGNGQYTYQKTISQINVGDLFTDKFREGLNQYVQAYWNADTRRYTEERADNRILGSSGAQTSPTAGKQIDLTFKAKFYTEDQYDKMLLDQIAQEHKEAELRVKTMVEDAGGLAELEKMMQLGDGKTEIGLPVRNYGEKKEKKSDKSLLDSTNQLSSGLSQLSSGLKGLGIDLGTGFDQFLGGLQSILSVINGVQTIINAFQIPSENANTAALIANTAALTSNTATNFLPFAQGGIAHAANGFIGGNYPSGDLLPIMVNSGELILNKAQQGNLASQLGGGIGGGLRLTTSISMRELRIALNSESQQRGKGKYVTTHG